MNIETAEKIQAICVAIRRKHMEMIWIAKESCDTDEYKALRRTVAGFMTDHFMELSENLFRQHPELVPNELLRDDGSNPYLSTT